MSKRVSTKFYVSCSIIKQLCFKGLGGARAGHSALNRGNGSKIDLSNLVGALLIFVHAVSLDEGDKCKPSKKNMCM